METDEHGKDSFLHVDLLIFKYIRNEKEFIISNIRFVRNDTIVEIIIKGIGIFSPFNTVFFFLRYWYS